MNEGIVTEPTKGLHTGFIACISGQDIFKFLKNTNINVMHTMRTAIESGMYDRAPTILYCDTNVIHVKINAIDLNSAMNESTYMCSLINDAFQLDIQNAIKQEIYPFVKTLYIADEIYFKAKKRYIVKIVMYKNEEIRVPTFRFIGYKIRHIEDLLIKDI